MSQNVSDHLLERLAANGVRRIYGYPGDGINGIMGALHRAGGAIDGDGQLEFVQVRHEEMAAFMACAQAKYTGDVSVCLATSGPGAIHLLNGLYDAKLDHQPVVAIVGQQARRRCARSCRCSSARPIARGTRPSRPACASGGRCSRRAR